MGRSETADSEKSFTAEMTRHFSVQPEAIDEANEAYNWYEAQKEGLGLEFLEAVDLFSNNLLRNPRTHSYYIETVRQGRLNKFPYTVVYEVFNEIIVIYSVFMGKQDPAKKRTK